MSLANKLLLKSASIPYLPVFTLLNANEKPRRCGVELFYRDIKTTMGMNVLP
jgi:hypothetical protein